MASRSLSAFAPLVCALALVACSGAGNDDLFEGTGEANDTSATSPAGATPPSGATPGGATPGGATPTPAPAATPPPPDTNAVPPPAAATCTPEIEPNNDVTKATPFKTSLCGKIDSASDVDYASFVVPKGATTIDVKHSEKNGKAAYRYFLGGAMLGTDPDLLEPIPGATYTVQIRLDRSGSTTALPTYELDIAFK